MKIFQIALLAAAATALRLEDDVTVDDLVDMGEEAGLGPKDLEELEKLPLEELDEDDVAEIVAALEKGEKPPRKQPKKKLGELPEGLTKDDVKAMMKEAKISVSDLEGLDSEELDKKAKKAGFSKDEIKMAKEAIEQLDSEDLELGEKKKPKKLAEEKRAPKAKKLGEKKGPKPPKKDDGEISLDSGDEEMVKKEMEKRGLKLEDLEDLDSEDVDAIMAEAGVELGEKKKPKKLGEKKKPKKLGEKKGPKPPKKDDGEISLDSGDEEMVKKEMEKRGLKLEDLEDLDSEDVDAIMAEAGVELGEKKKPKKLGEKKGPKPPKKDDDGEISLDSGDEEMIKKEMEKRGLKLEDLEDLDSEDVDAIMEEAGVELGEKKKPKKLGEKKGPKPPKKDDGEISLDSGDEEMVKKEMEKRGLKLEDLEDLDSEDVDAIMEEAGVELGEKKKPKKLGEKGPKPEGELEAPCSEDDDECWAELAPCSEDDDECWAELEKELPCALSDDECWEALEAEFEGEGDKPKGKKPKGPKPELAEGDKKGPKPPKKDEGCGFEKEAREALEDFDGDGSGRLEAGEGKEVLKAIGLPEDVADMLIEGAEEELDEAPTADDIAGAMCELARHFAEKEGVSVDDVADFTKDVDFSKVTKDDVEEFAAYVEAEVEF